MSHFHFRSLPGSGNLARVPTPADEIEFRRVRAPGYADRAERRDAVDVLVNGLSLSESLDSAPFGVRELEAMDATAAWEANGNYVPILNCVCGDVGCGGILVSVTTTETTVTWSGPTETYVFDRARFGESLRAALGR